MTRFGDSPEGPERAAASYPIVGLAWPGSPGMIGLAPCPGVRARRFRPELLTPDLDEMQRWGAAAMLCPILDQEIEALPLERLAYEVRRRGMGYVQLHGAGQEQGMDLQSEWSRVRGRVVQALRNGERLLIPRTEGHGRAALLLAWLMIEGGAGPEEAISAVRTVCPGAIGVAVAEASVRTYVPLV